MEVDKNNRIPVTLRDLIVAWRHFSYIALSYPEPKDEMEDLAGDVLQMRLCLEIAGVDCGEVDREMVADSWVFLWVLSPGNSLIEDHKIHLHIHGRSHEDVWYLNADWDSIRTWHEATRGLSNG